MATPHSIHGSSTDVGRMIGEFPRPHFELPDDLRRGFTRTECQMLGHWLREKDQSKESAGAPDPAPSGVGATLRDSMVDAYSRGAGRKGECAEQLRVRARLVLFVRIALAAWGRSWTMLAGDATDWHVVLPFTSENVAAVATAAQPVTAARAAAAPDAPVRAEPVG